MAPKGASQKSLGDKPGKMEHLFKMSHWVCVTSWPFYSYVLLAANYLYFVTDWDIIGPGCFFLALPGVDSLIVLHSSSRLGTENTNVLTKTE